MRLSILKRIAGAKWGYGIGALNITYKTYVQPVLNYCNEVLFSASNKVLGMLDVFQNQSLHLITVGVKSTSALAMRLFGDLQLMTNLDKDYELLSHINPLEFMVLDIRLDLTLNVRKKDICPTALRAIALETINTHYPPDEWLHIYTDGSLLDFTQGAGADLFFSILLTCRLSHDSL
ncbi:uncharacterized protein TNCV_2422551 [Trichonephila clavipes]|nr:uncharacterized protein TNCV_2422551 [Trichonephila clavipes]